MTAFKKNRLYGDHLGNIRLSYADDNNNGSVNSSEIREENNYYPFGLKHKGYNSNVSANNNGVADNWKFQGQEFTEDLGLNTYEWKYRVSDPAIGRFWQIDPLAEDYVYNGTYNFAENRVIDGNELEGLEWVDAKGNKVYDPNVVNEDGTRGAYTESATTTDRNIGKQLLLTKTGTEQFNKLVNSDVPIQVIFDTENAPVSKEGVPIGGKTDRKGVQTGEDAEGNIVAGILSSAVIRLFSKNIDAQEKAVNDDDSSTGANLNGTEIPDGFNFAEILSAIFGHEIEHTTTQNVVETYNGVGAETTPTKISDKIIKEIQEDKKD